MEKFIDICKKVNDSNESLIKDIVLQWDLENISDSECDQLIDNCHKYLGKIDKNKMPFFLEGLYSSDYLIKVKLFTICFTATHLDIPFMTPLENISISKEKFKFLLPTLIDVSSKNFSGISDCLYLIILNNDSSGEYLDGDLKNALLDSMEKKFQLFLQFIQENGVFDELNSSIEILADLSTFINNSNILHYISMFLDTDIDNYSKVFIIKSLLFNNINIDDSYLEDVASDILVASRFFEVLESINRDQLFPLKYRNQEYIARSNMINWLVYPTELGEEPLSISFVDILEVGNYIYYIYKFTAKNGSLKERREMIGISGGFLSDRITARSNGMTFSNFDTIGDNYFEQAKDVLDMLVRKSNSKF